MAVRLNMSPALLRLHIHKSTRNDCKPKTHTHHPEKQTAAYIRLHLQLHTSRRCSGPLVHRAADTKLYCIGFF